MKLSPFSTFAPKTVEEALSILRKCKDRAVIKAGGTALIPQMNMGLIIPEYVILLNGIGDMSRIRKQGGALHIGAMASLHDIKNNTLVKKGWKPLAEAIETVSAPVMHYQSTIGGNLCQNTRCKYYNQSDFFRQIKGRCFKSGGERCHVSPSFRKCQSVYQGDLAPMMICLNAKAVVISPSKEEEMPVEELFTGKGRNPIGLAPNQIIREIILPPLGKKNVGYEKLRERGSLDYPELGVAVMIELKGNIVKKSRIVISAMGPAPIDISEPHLSSRRLDRGFIQEAENTVYSKVTPVGNLSLGPGYRKKMTRVLVRRILDRCK